MIRFESRPDTVSASCPDGAWVNRKTPHPPPHSLPCWNTPSGRAKIAAGLEHDCRTSEVSELSPPSPATPVDPPIDFATDPEVVRVVAEGERLAYGHLVNPAFAAETSLIDPLPH